MEEEEMDHEEERSEMEQQQLNEFSSKNDD